MLIFFFLTSITLHFKWILKKIPTFLIPWRSQDKNLLSALQTFFLFLVKMSFFFQMGGFIWHFQAVWPSLKSAVCEQIKPNDGVRFFCTTEPRQPVYPGTFQSLNSRKTLIPSATWNCFRLKKAFEGPTFKLVLTISFQNCHFFKLILNMLIQISSRSIVYCSTQVLYEHFSHDFIKVETSYSQDLMSWIFRIHSKHFNI